MGKKPRESPASSETPTTLASTEVSERWSVKRKTDLAMRLLRGETLHAVFRGNAYALGGFPASGSIGTRNTSRKRSCSR